MDGTGEFLDGFLSALGSSCEVRIIRYPTDRALGYEELLELALLELPEGKPVFLLGESFGGPLALKVAAARKREVRGVLLVASFARYLKGRLRSVLPFLRVAPVVVPPTWVLSWLLTNGRGFAGEGRLRNTLLALSRSAVKRRMEAVLDVDARNELKELHVPVLCLRAVHDRVVAAAAAEEVVAAARSGTVVVVPGPHFLLQCEAERCADIVRTFVRDAAF